MMHQTNPTEIFRERQLVLLREADDRRLARRLREVPSAGYPRSERRMAGFRRAIALWGRTSIPFLGS